LSGRPGAVAILPNPFYQIYEGAALLRGRYSRTSSTAPRATGMRPDFSGVPEAVWNACELLFLCSPGNPTGMNLDLQPPLPGCIDQAQRHDFVIAADECYSEIYFDDRARPCGLLEAAAAAGRDGFSRCVVFHSLSKRSNLPGLRSGFVAGDADILDAYYRYRTYHGCAMPNHVQRASIAAWQDEAHVDDNRAAYRRKFAAVTPILESVLHVPSPRVLSITGSPRPATMRLLPENFTQPATSPFCPAAIWPGIRTTATPAAVTHASRG
jgi:N-succinyldiaminopimelate aminotransferase